MSTTLPGTIDDIMLFREIDGKNTHSHIFEKKRTFKYPLCFPHLFPVISITIKLSYEYAMNECEYTGIFFCSILFVEISLSHIRLIIYIVCNGFCWVTFM